MVHKFLNLTDGWVDGWTGVEKSFFIFVGAWHTCSSREMCRIFEFPDFAQKNVEINPFQVLEKIARDGPIISFLSELLIK